MSAMLLCLAAALLVLPPARTLRRLRSMSPVAGETDALTGVRRWMSRRGLAPIDLVFLSCVPFAVTGAGSAAVATLIVAAVVRRRFRRSRAAALRDREQRGVMAGLDVVIGELRVGTHPAAACAAASAECAGSAAEAFGVAAARARLGGSSSGGFTARDSIVGDDLRRIANAWAVAEANGLALADLLQASRTDISGRSRFRQRVESGTAGARATAAVLAGLPALGIGLGQMMGAEPLRVLLGGGLGGVLLVVGTALVAAGLVWTDRIVDNVVT